MPGKHIFLYLPPHKKLRRGEVREWLNRAVSKTVIGAILSRVRIPPSPLRFVLRGRVLKLADRRVSEARVRKDVWVQVPPRPLTVLAPFLMASTTLLPKHLRERFIRELQFFRVNEGEKANLRKRPTQYTGKSFTKNSARAFLEHGIEKLAELQDKLYAHNQHGLLIVLQAMDAAGKDGAIRHIMSGLNPQGVQVTSFKQPSAEELDHDFLWRHYKALPPRGEIGIFNRSHYENVLVSRVHPELVLRENLPTVRSVEQINKKFWKERYHNIRQFEQIVSHSGTSIVKFFLHVSKGEQRKRLLERIDDTQKNWKFSVADVRERAYWNEYMRAYGDAITATSTTHAPWYIIPADDKWYARVAMAAIIYLHMEKLHLDYPTITAEQRAELLKARALLEQ